MEKPDIDLVMMGNVSSLVDYKVVQRWRSKLFQVKSISVLSSLPDPSHPSPFLDQTYLDDQLRNILSDKRDVLQIGVANFGLENNYYIRRIHPRTAVLSLRNPLVFLQRRQISTENFLIKNIYEMVTLCAECGSLVDDSVYAIPHRDTRGCLFDLNGDIGDIVFNTETPHVCNDCKTRLGQKQMPNDYLKVLETELRKIKKTRWQSIEIWVRNHPFTSMIITLLAGAMLSVIASIGYDLVTGRFPATLDRGSANTNEEDG